MQTSQSLPSAVPTRDALYWLRTLAYGAFTLLVAYEMVAGAMWDLLQIEYVRVVLTRLGYPHSLLFVLGVWKLPCALVLLLPGLPRLEEWAYAGAFFNYYGALASHLAMHDGPERWVWPLLFGVATLASWALRPADRRLAPAGATHRGALAWIVPICVVAALVVVSLLSLPTVPPP